MDTDEHILDHVAELAKCMGARILLLRVAHFHTRDSRTAETSEAREYYTQVEARLNSHGITDIEPIEAQGEPADTIIRVAEEQKADLIAMSTHGHGFIVDTLFGSVSEQVRHRTELPVLLLRHPVRQ
jgi:nucleotide-binding universal stress UspA family protein